MHPHSYVMQPKAVDPEDPPGTGNPKSNLGKPRTTTDLSGRSSRFAGPEEPAQTGNPKSNLGFAIQHSCDAQLSLIEACLSQLQQLKQSISRLGTFCHHTMENTSQEPHSHAHPGEPASPALSSQNPTKTLGFSGQPQS